MLKLRKEQKDQWFVLFYDFCENQTEKRKPYREAHIAYADKAQNAGILQMAGPFEDNFDGAIIIFKCKDIKTVEAHAKDDPYVKNGIVTSWKVRPWKLVRDSRK